MVAPILQAFVITLREGLEAFLIVAISLAYLRKSGRQALAKAVYCGIAIATVLSAAGGYALYNASNQEWLEGPLAILAAVSVAWMVIHMWRAGRFMKRDIEGHLGLSSARLGASAFVGVLLFTVLMITREGIETAVLLLQLQDTVDLALGAVAGLAGATAVAWLWSRFGHRVNLGLFFQVTAIFLFVFVVQLLVQGVHEMSEQGYLPFSEPIHLATEAWGPESRFGHMLTYLLVIAPMAWLAIAGLIAGRKPATPPARPRMEEQTVLR